MPCSSEKHYGIVSRWLHWLTAFLVLGMIACGFSLSLLPGSWKPWAIAGHKSFGVLILFLACVRLGWRIMHPPPPFSQVYSAAVRFSASATHAVLYLLTFAMPLSGWIMSSAFSKPVAFFALFELPPLVEKSRELALQYREWHETLAYALLVLAGLHIAAALYHHFIRKDGVLERMTGSCKHS